MGGCQNYGAFLDPYTSTAPNIFAAAKKGSHFLTTIHICGGYCEDYDEKVWAEGTALSNSRSHSTVRFVTLSSPYVEGSAGVNALD